MIRSVARTLWNPPTDQRCCSDQYVCRRVVRGGNDNVQWKYISARARPGAVQGLGTGDTSWWTMSHWRVGCAGFWEEDPVPEMNRMVEWKTYIVWDIALWAFLGC